MLSTKSIFSLIYFKKFQENPKDNSLKHLYILDYKFWESKHLIFSCSLVQDTLNVCFRIFLMYSFSYQTLDSGLISGSLYEEMTFTCYNSL